MYRVIDQNGDSWGGSTNFNEAMEVLLRHCAANNNWIAPNDNSFIIGLDCYIGVLKIIREPSGT